MVVDLSKTLDDLLSDLGGTRDQFKSISYRDSVAFQNTRFGKFSVDYVPSSSNGSLLFQERLAAFLHQKYKTEFLRGDTSASRLRLMCHFHLWRLMNNSIEWGHQGDEDIPIKITCYYSARGFLIAVRDRGAGFPVRRTVERMQKGKKYWKDHGDALKGMHEDNRCIYTYNTKGNESYVFYRLSGRRP